MREDFMATEMSDHDHIYTDMPETECELVEIVVDYEGSGIFELDSLCTFHFDLGVKTVPVWKFLLTLEDNPAARAQLLELMRDHPVVPVK